jgi:hypothetical protein
MRARSSFLVVAAGLLLLGSGPIRPAFAQAGGVHGADPMDGKNRSGPEGYVWAPLSRDQSPSGTAPTEAKGQPNRAALDARPVPDTSKNLSPGADPGTAMPTPNTGKAVSKP